MLYLYLDESGDLGFDFVNKKPTKHFVISIFDCLITPPFSCRFRRYRSSKLENAQYIGNLLLIRESNH